MYFLIQYLSHCLKISTSAIGALIIRATVVISMDQSWLLFQRPINNSIGWVCKFIVVSGLEKDLSICAESCAYLERGVAEQRKEGIFILQTVILAPIQVGKRLIICIYLTCDFQKQFLTHDPTWYTHTCKNIIENFLNLPCKVHNYIYLPSLCIWHKDTEYRPFGWYVTPRSPLSSLIFLLLSAHSALSTAEPKAGSVLMIPFKTDAAKTRELNISDVVLLWTENKRHKHAQILRSPLPISVFVKCWQ